MYYYNDENSVKVYRPSMFSPAKQKIRISRLEKAKNIDIMVKRFEKKQDLFTGKPIQNFN